MDYKTDFPVLANTTYLNTASSGILSDTVLRWRRQHDEHFSLAGSGFRLQQADLLEEVRASVAGFFHHSTSLTYLVPNFSSGLTVLLNGLAGNPKFLLLENEYPSVYYPVQSRGARCVRITPGAHPEADIADAMRREQPDIFLFSIVQYATGLRLEQDFLLRLKQLFPQVLIIADGTQHCGSEVLNFPASGIDVLLGSGYKWLLGGYGNGYVLLKQEVADRLYRDARQRPLPQEAFLRHKDVLSMHFEPGHLDTLCFGSLKQSLDYITGIGTAAIADKVAALGRLAKAAFSERGLLDDYITKRDTHSSIFRLNISDALIRKIQEANITGTIRGKGLRVSFHFYNEAEDLERLLGVIDEHKDLQ